MECVKCKFQFCWFCLSEFYTSYHFELTQWCPYRYCLLHSIEVFCALILFAKWVVISPRLQESLLIGIPLAMYFPMLLLVSQALDDLKKATQDLEQGQADNRGRLHLTREDRDRVRQLGRQKRAATQKLTTRGWQYLFVFVFLLCLSTIISFNRMVLFRQFLGCALLLGLFEGAKILKARVVSKL